MARELGKIPEVTVYSAENMENQSGVLSFTVYGLSSEEVGARLAKRGIAVRAGLHCSPLAHKSAGTFPDGTVRASVSAFNTRRDVIALTNAVKDIVKSI
jgi:selenocysteine lyase/cysteine desulfurase